MVRVGSRQSNPGFRNWLGPHGLPRKRIKGVSTDSLKKIPVEINKTMQHEAMIEF